MAETVRLRASEADFTFKVGELSTEDLKVTGFTGTEGLSELFHFRVELCSSRRDVNFAEVVGKPCTLEIASSQGSRYVNGIVRRFARTREGSSLSHYAAEVVPVHWLLTRRYQSRIFQKHNCQDMTVPGIIQKVLTDAGIPQDNYRLALQRTSYPERDFVVQYRESDFDFISRLMEHEGIFYFFEHTAEGHKMVLGDSPVAHAANPLGAEWPYRDPNGLVEEKEFVFSALDQQEIHVGAICLDDYNFTNPGMELRATVRADQYTNLEFSDYPGEYAAREHGSEYAQIRLEEFRASRHVVRFASVVRGLLPGYKFTLIEHPVEALNIEYLVTHVTHRARQPQSAEEEAGGQAGARHETDIRGIPATIPFRPPRRTRRPVILGTQTALVTGPSGEEIYTDDEGYGRVKVQFHWDRDGQHNENSSCWIRVSQGWAGGNYGMVFLPRVGQEVIVSFLEGNPDRPIITGRVYNNDNMPPYELPAEKTKSTIKSRSSVGGGGFNEIRFEDKKDSEQIFIHGQKDLDIRIREVQKDWIGKDKHEIIGGTQAKSIGGDEGRTIGKDLSIVVKGKHSLDITGDSCHYATGNLAIATDADLYLVGAKGALKADSYVELTAPQVYIEGREITLKAGGSFIKIDSGGVTIVGGEVKINSGGGPGSAQSVAIADCFDPAEPAEAATGDPGKDFTYQQEALAMDPLELAPLHDESQADETQTHWIGVRLYDDNGLPLAGERYNIVMPDGTHVARGVTNERGEVEVRGIDPGSCQITFPDLDGLTWEPGPPPAGASGGGAGGAGAPILPGGGGMPGVPGLG